MVNFQLDTDNQNLLIKIMYNEDTVLGYITPKKRKNKIAYVIYLATYDAKEHMFYDIEKLNKLIIRFTGRMLPENLKNWLIQKESEIKKLSYTEDLSIKQAIAIKELFENNKIYIEDLKNICI